MARAIVIDSCKGCPHNDHKGGFGSPAYVPICRKAGRELPHTLAPTPSGRCIARQTEQIPDWCPPLPVHKA